jgi:hypothetical protein
MLLYKLIRTVDRHAQPDAQGRLDVRRSYDANVEASFEPSGEEDLTEMRCNPLLHPINSLQALVYGTMLAFGRLGSSASAERERIRSVWSSRDAFDR